MAQDIGAQIAQALREYTNDVVEEIDRQAIKIANKAVKELKQTSPRRTHGGRHYADGWGRTKVDGNQVVYNKTKPGLTHLLEHGYAPDWPRSGYRWPTTNTRKLHSFRF